MLAPQEAVPEIGFEIDHRVQIVVAVGGYRDIDVFCIVVINDDFRADHQIQVTLRIGYPVHEFY
jgi:hypothetical protein